MKAETIDHFPQEEIKQIPVEKNITILNLGHGRYLFKSPFPVNIVYNEDTYIASSYDLNIFGYGESEEEALRDLCDSIIEYYGHLKRSLHKLGSLLKRDFAFLSRMILEVENS